MQRHARERQKVVAGRPKKLSLRDEKVISRNVATGVFETAAEAARHASKFLPTPVSRQTVSRALRRWGLSSVKRKKMHAISSRNKKIRFKWAKDHRHWTSYDWNRVVWSDESKIRRFNSDGLRWSWTRAPGVLNERSITQTEKYGGGGIVVWGCISKYGVGRICQIVGNMDATLYVQILSDQLLGSLDQLNLDVGEVIFQQDNDSKHVSKLARKFFSSKDIHVLDWPPQSPDLNPIENVWAHLKKKVARRPLPARGMTELWEIVQREWAKLTVDYCNSLVESMPSRVKAVIRAKGGWTKY